MCVWVWIVYVGQQVVCATRKKCSAFTFDLARAALTPRRALPIDHFRYMLLCAFNRCLQWNLLEQCTRASARRCRQARRSRCQRWRGLQRSCGFAFYLHFMYSNCDIYKHTHIPSLSPSLLHSFSFTAPLSFRFLSFLLSPAKTLTHVPLSTVIDIHLCVTRPTPFTPLPYPILLVASPAPHE